MDRSRSDIGASTPVREHVRDELGTPATDAAHLEALARQHNVRLRFRPATSETIARLHWGPPPVIELPPIRSRTDYYAGLHEFGHLIAGQTGITLYDEITANTWALDNAQVEPSISVAAANRPLPHRLRLLQGPLPR